QLFLSTCTATSELSNPIPTRCPSRKDGSRERTTWSDPHPISNQYTCMLIIDKEMKEARKAAAERQASSSDPERQKYITEQAKERAAQKAQRARILAEIENDKAERKARAEREKQATSGTGTGHANTSIN